MFAVIISLILVLGGLGYQQLGYLVLFGTIFLGLYVRSQKYKLPTGYGYFLLFVFASVLTIQWSNFETAMLYPSLLIFSGGIFWVISKNRKINIAEVLFVSTLVLSVIFFVLRKIGFTEINFLSLSTQSAVDHAHIGDLWALSVVALTYMVLKSRKFDWYTILAVIVGTVIIIVSGSRSAITSSAIGILFLLIRYKKSNFGGARYLIPTLVGFLIVGFIYISVHKDTVFSRPYYIQSLLGFSRYPFGVGLGNFGTISQQFPLGWGTFSTIAHNLIAELLTGMGVLIFVFILWIAKIWNQINTIPLMNKALLVALSVNWFFDYTYAIPLFVWMFFLLLGSGRINSTGKG